VELVALIQQKNIQNIVEFGTSFGISTLFLAQGALKTNGRIITTELIESKAAKAQQNFVNAGVDDLIEVRVGDAMETLQDYKQPIDLLLLDGWKDLYLPLFRLLESNFHKDTIIYVDNADMSEVKMFLNQIREDGKYQFESKFGGKIVLVKY
jgi:predicted O-methyltransferase YrrM